MPRSRRRAGRVRRDRNASLRCDGCGRLVEGSDRYSQCMMQLTRIALPPRGQNRRISWRRIGAASSRVGLWTGVLRTECWGTRSPSTGRCTPSRGLRRCRTRWRTSGTRHRGWRAGWVLAEQCVLDLVTPMMLGKHIAGLNDAMFVFIPKASDRRGHEAVGLQESGR